MNKLSILRHRWDDLICRVGVKDENGFCTRKPIQYEINIYKFKRSDKVATCFACGKVGKRVKGDYINFCSEKCMQDAKEWRAINLL